MAKVVGPLHSTEARGRCGALTYNTWRGLHTVKAASGPGTQNTDKQTAIQACLAQTVQNWKDYGLAFYDQWQDYCDSHTVSDWTGRQRHQTPYAAYVQINFWRVWFQLAIWHYPPQVINEALISGIDAIQYETNVALEAVWSCSGDPESWHFLVWMYQTSSAARHPSIRDAQYAGYWSPEFEDGSIPYDGDKYSHLWVFPWSYETGLKGVPFRLPVLPPFVPP